MTNQFIDVFDIYEQHGDSSSPFYNWVINNKGCLSHQLSRFYKNRLRQREKLDLRVILTPHFVDGIADIRLSWFVKTSNDEQFMLQVSNYLKNNYHGSYFTSPGFVELTPHLPISKAEALQLISSLKEELSLQWDVVLINHN